MHQTEHLVFAGVRVLRDAVQLQCLRRAAATLIQCGDEALAGPDLAQLLFVHGSAPGRVSVTARLGCGVRSSDSRSRVRRRLIRPSSGSGRRASASDTLEEGIPPPVGESWMCRDGAYAVEVDEMPIAHREVRVVDRHTGRIDPRDVDRTGGRYLSGFEHAQVPAGATGGSHARLDIRTA